MKKAQRFELAQKCYREIKRLDLEAKIEGNWILLSPPNKIPPQLTMDIINCSDFLIRLLQNSSADL